MGKNNWLLNIICPETPTVAQAEEKEQLLARDKKFTAKKNKHEILQILYSAKKYDDGDDISHFSER